MSDTEIPTSGGSYTRDRRGQLKRNEEPTEQDVQAAPADTEHEAKPASTGSTSKEKET